MDANISRDDNKYTSGSRRQGRQQANQAGATVQGTGVEAGTFSRTTCTSRVYSKGVKQEEAEKRFCEASGCVRSSTRRTERRKVGASVRIRECCLRHDHGLRRRAIAAPHRTAPVRRCAFRDSRVNNARFSQKSEHHHEQQATTHFSKSGVTGGVRMVFASRHVHLICAVS